MRGLYEILCFKITKHHANKTLFDSRNAQAVMKAVLGIFSLLWFLVRSGK